MALLVLPVTVAPAEDMLSIINTLLLTVTELHAFQPDHATPWMLITVYNKDMAQKEKTKHIQKKKTPLLFHVLLLWNVSTT